MQNRTKIVCGVFASITFGAGLISQAICRDPQFAVGIVSLGRWQGDARIGYCASLTNSGTSACLLTGVRYEWKDAAGQLQSASASSFDGRLFRSGAAETVTFLIPPDAQSVRVCVLYDFSSLTRTLKKRIGPVCGKLALNPTVFRFPKLAVWLMEIGNTTDRQFLSPWAANRGVLDRGSWEETLPR